MLALDDYSQGAKEVLGREANLANAAALKVALHAHQWDNRDSGADFDASLDGFNIVQLHYNSNLNLVLREDTVNGVATRHIFLEGNKVLAVELADVDPPATGKGMVRGADQDKAVGSQRKDFNAFPGLRVNDDAEVHFASQARLVYTIDAAILHVEVHFRICFQKGFGYRFHLVEADTVNRSNTHCARDLFADRLESRLQALKTIQDFSTGFIDNTPTLGREDRLPFTHEQGAEALFQAFDLLADRGLGDKVSSRRL